MCTTQYINPFRDYSMCLLVIPYSRFARSLAFLPKSHVRHVLMRFMSCIFWSIALIYLKFQ